MNKESTPSNQYVAEMALHWLQHFTVNRPYEMSQIVESLYTNASSGNGMAIMATSVLDDMENKRPINALNMLSLCWLIRSIYDGDHLHAEEENEDGEDGKTESEGEGLERFL